MAMDEHLQQFSYRLGENVGTVVDLRTSSGDVLTGLLVGDGQTGAAFGVRLEGPDRQPSTTWVAVAHIESVNIRS